MKTICCFFFPSFFLSRSLALAVSLSFFLFSLALRALVIPFYIRVCNFKKKILLSLSLFPAPAIGIGPFCFSNLRTTPARKYLFSLPRWIMSSSQIFSVSIFISDVSPELARHKHPSLLTCSLGRGEQQRYRSASGHGQTTPERYETQLSHERERLRVTCSETNELTSRFSAYVMSAVMLIAALPRHVFRLLCS